VTLFKVMTAWFVNVSLCLLTGTALAVLSPAQAAAQSTAKKATTAKRNTRATKPAQPVRAKGKPQRTRAVAHIPDLAADGRPNLLSQAAIVIDHATGETLYAKHADSIMPIASITKLMTALVVVSGHGAMDEAITITEEDIDVLKNSRSRLNVGASFRRADLMRLALMASDNRAASALGRSWPGGTAGFVERMNREAKRLGMDSTRFVDATGLSPQNVSSPQDLTKLVAAASGQSLIREYSTTPALHVTFPDTGRTMGFQNSNALVRGGDWNIDVSKTGFINESGKCLVMRATVHNRPVILVLLNALGQHTRLGDANRVRRWLERGPGAS
jgi:serine-type D-Ala-D-Ala endopeptidase (penicillin-binding protein 7)